MTRHAKNLRNCAALILAAVLLLLPACKKDDGSLGNFYYPIPANPERLDPQIVSGTAEDTILLGCMEGLVRIAGDGTAEPGVAASWELSPDGKTYTFHLREDAKWHAAAAFYDKIPKEFFEKFDNHVTAQDFVFAFRRAVMPSIGSPLAERLGQIKNVWQIRQGTAKPETLGVTAIDKSTLQITLSQPGAEFLPSLAFAPFFPCSQAFYDATQGRYGLEPSYLLCNGPFYLSRWQEGGSSVILRKNPDYAGAEPVLPALVTLQVDSNAAGYAARLSSGMYSLCPLESAADLPSGSSLISVENRVTALVFNCAAGLMRQSAVRAALVGVLDLTKLGANAYTAAPGLVPNSALVGDENYRAKAGGASLAKPDAKNAKAALAAALAKSGESALELTVLCAPELEQPVRQLLQQWNAAFGLLVKTGVETMTAQSLESRAAGGSFAAAVLPLTLRGQSPLSFLAQFSADSPQNLPRFDSAEYAKLLNSLRNAVGSKAAISAALRAEDYLMQNGVCLPLFEGESFFALGKNVSGVEFPFSSVPDFRSGKIKS
ncbi:MAG: peptide ABC transporter substrate-binding protein [Oscillospiraceae bacterium]|jgi:ABC-type oligopeptide transport system substrate-binding subunit|nr:peptide ABC transporter substrate-binding protein [Oscillospiraceae bacterium]